MKTISITLFLIGTSLSLFPQKKISLDRISVARAVEIRMPVKTDSTDLNGKKFEEKDLLSTYITLPQPEEFTEEIRAEVMREYFFFPSARENARFQLLSFDLRADRYTKAKVKVASAGMFEVYIDGNMEISKTSVEDSLTAAKVLDREFTLIPTENRRFIIKYLSLPGAKAPDGVKVSIETNGKDTLSNISIIHDGKRLVNVEDIIGGTRVLNARISPDGQFVLLDYRTVTEDGKTETYQELADTRTSRSTYLGNRQAKWMPESNRYYYTLRVGNTTRLISVNPENMQETILSENIPAGDFSFTPDEKNLVYTEKESFDERKGDLKLLASPEDRQSGYYDRYYLYRYNLENGLKERLTFGKHSTLLRDISPGSRYLLYSTTKETTSESPFSLTSMYRLDLQTMAVEALWEDDPYAYSAQFSPDGKQVLILGSPGAFGGTGLNLPESMMPNHYDTQAYIMDVETKAVEAISREFAPAINMAYWNHADKLVYLLTTDRDYENLYSYNPAKKEYKLLSLPEEIIKTFSPATHTARAAITGTGTFNPAKSYVVDLKNLNTTLVSNPMGKSLQDVTFGQVNDWDFTASDGTLISGRYYLPPNFDAAATYPMIVYYYGGTTPTPRLFDHSYPMQVYAALGYVVYIVQPSGTTGFGQEFSARHVNAWGKRTAEDIIEGVQKFTAEHPYVDKERIGCIGASYGGFMTMYLLTQTDLFAAAVSHAGISSLSSYWGEGYWGYTYSARASTGSYPWNNRELYVDQSPLFNADKIHTPLLLLHGTEDTNVPIGESIQMYTALRILDRPVEFIQVKGENHGVRNYNRRREWNYSIYAWFAKWLQNDPGWWENLYPDK